VRALLCRPSGKWVRRRGWPGAGWDDRLLSIWSRRRRRLLLSGGGGRPDRM